MKLPFKREILNYLFQMQSIELSTSFWIQIANPVDPLFYIIAKIDLIGILMRIPHQILKSLSTTINLDLAGAIATLKTIDKLLMK